MSLRRPFFAIAWLAAWALILVLAPSLPGWLAIGLAVAVFAVFLLAARERPACLDPEGCGGRRRSDASRSP